MLDNERHTRYQVTENNPKLDKQGVLEKLSSLGTMLYAIASSEVGASGTAHIHAFVVFQNGITSKSLKNAFPRAHLEVCRGSNQENRDYITKQGDFVEVGDMPLSVAAKKRKGDIASEVIGLIVDNGLPPLEVAKRFRETADYVVKNFRNLNEIYQLTLSQKMR